jgi:hypothetical protein
MATVRVEVSIAAGADVVWAVLRDFADGPTRMAPGYVVASHLLEDDPGIREVTFANGLVVRERLVAVDDDRRRLVYALIAGSARPEHDNASMQVFPESDARCRFVWIHDVLPDELAAPILAAMEGGVPVIERTLARAPLLTSWGQRAD